MNKANARNYAIRALLDIARNITAHTSLLQLRTLDDSLTEEQRAAVCEALEASAAKMRGLADMMREPE